MAGRRRAGRSAGELRLWRPEAGLLHSARHRGASRGQVQADWRRWWWQHGRNHGHDGLRIDIDVSTQHEGAVAQLAGRAT